MKEFQKFEAIQKITKKDGESRASFLEEYTVDITALARKKQLDPVVGRNIEIERLIEILSRRKKKQSHNYW